MSLFRKLFYRKPPDGLLEISERLYVFDCCFADAWEEKNYQVYLGSIIGQLREHFPDASFLVFNFRGTEAESEMSKILSEYDITIMDYPRHYEGCPILSMELMHHFLRSTESWLELGPQNVLLMHCEWGGWPVLAFMLAALLIYRKQYTGESRTLDMVYKQAPGELLQLLSPLNPMPSQLRYLQYVSRRNLISQWPPSDRALTLDCVIIRQIPDFDGKGGCRPVFRIYGQDPHSVADRTPKLLFSTPKKSKAVRLYKQTESELVKIDINCHIQGDIVLECSSLNDDMEREEMMFRVIFNTSFIRSNILMVNRDEIDILWQSKDHFPKDFRAEVLFSDMDAGASTIAANLSCFEEKEGLPIEAFAKVQEFFNHVDWLDSKADAALSMLQKISVSHNTPEKSDYQGTGSSSPLQRTSPQKSKDDQKHTKIVSSSTSPALLIQENQILPLPVVSIESVTSEKEIIPINFSQVQQEPNQYVPIAESQPVSSPLIKESVLLASQTPPPSDDTEPSGGIENSDSASIAPVCSYPTLSMPLLTPPLIPPIQPSLTTSKESFTSPPPIPSLPHNLTTPPLMQETCQSSTTPSPSERSSPPPPFPLPTAVSIGSSSLKPGSLPYSQVVSLPATPRKDTRSRDGIPAPPPPPAPTHRQDSGIRSGNPPPPPPPPPPTLREDSSFRAGPPLLPPIPQPPCTPPLKANSALRAVSSPSPTEDSRSRDRILQPPPTPALNHKQDSGFTARTPPPPPPPPPTTLREDRSFQAGPSLPPPTPLPPRTPPLKGNSARRALSSPSPPPPPAPPLPPLSLQGNSAKAVSPPPQQFMLAPTSPPSAPPPPPPPLAPRLPPKVSESKLQHSSVVPSAPPLPAAFDKGISKAPSAPILGPPYSSPANVRGRSPSRPLGPKNLQTKKLKPLHWLKLTRAVQGSLWAETQKSGEASNAPEIDMSELESLFSATAPSSISSGKSSRSIGGPKSDIVQLIEHHRAYNCEIMLSKVKVPLNELMSSVLSLEESALDVDQVDNLIKFCPTKEEMDLLKGYTGEPDKLGKCEKFFLELMKVPRVEAKLRVFSFKIQFRTQVSDLRNNLNIVNSAADEIRNSVKLKRIMQTVLSLGNALNQGTARGSAVGFRLDSLLKLTETRARNTRMTLMHYLCKVVAEKCPELLDFSKDLSSVEPASKIQLKYMAEEMQAISKGLEKVVQELSMSENDGPVSEDFRKNLKEFLCFAEAEVRSLALLYSSVGRNMDALIIYFGEDPARCPFEQVISTLLNFTRTFNQSHDENCKQSELEKKRTEKELGNHKLAASIKEPGDFVSSLNKIRKPE